MNKVIDKGFRSCRFVSAIVKHPVDKKLTWKEHCKQLCCTISKYVGVMYKVKHYVNNQALCILYHSLINSRAQYGLLPGEEQLHVM